MPGIIANGGNGLISGKDDAGNIKPFGATPEGHLEVAIHGPRNPFGSIHTESLAPTFQLDAVYGINDGGHGQANTITSGTGTITSVESTYTAQTGTTIYSQAILQSRKRLRYRPGQGSVCRFTAAFTTGVANSYQVAGLGHAEDGFFFGYKDTSFGILYSHHGVREVQTLTVSTASTTDESITVTLGGVANSVTVTNSNNVNRTAYEISVGTYIGWKAEVIGSTVIFIADSVGDKTGTFSITASTAAGTFAETKAGVAATESFTASSSWNVDSLDGTGPTGFTIDPTKLNVYQIKLQYLGAGSIEFQVEVPFANSNNPEFVTVHRINPQNSLTRTTISNPGLPFTLAAYSAGSTTNLTVRSGSFAGFIEGEKRLQGNRFSYINSKATVDAAAYYNLFSVRNTRYFGGKSNQSVVNLLSITAALKHNNPCTVYVIRNATLVGNPVFSQYSNSSCTYYSTAATSCTFSDNAQLIWTGTLGDTGNFIHDFEDDVTLQPGEMVTVAAKTVFGSASYVVVGMNTREDQ